MASLQTKLVDFLVFKNKMVSVNSYIEFNVNYLIYTDNRQRETTSCESDIVSTSWSNVASASSQCESEVERHSSEKCSCPC